MTKTQWIIIAVVTIIVAMLVPYSVAESKKEAAKPESEPSSIQTVPEVEQEPEPMTIEEMVIHYAGEYGADPNLAWWIAKCESGFRNVPNTNGLKYGIGPFQWIRSSWAGMCEGDIWNAEDNVKCGVEWIAKGATTHWGTEDTEWGSYQCWAPNTIL